MSHTKTQYWTKNSRIQLLKLDIDKTPSTPSVVYCQAENVLYWSSITVISTNDPQNTKTHQNKNEEQPEGKTADDWRDEQLENWELQQAPHSDPNITSSRAQL